MNEPFKEGDMGQKGSNSINQNSNITEVIKGEKIDLSQKDQTNEEIENILKKIGNPENIKEINLSYNQLNTIPQSIFKFTNLEKLDLTYNNIKSIPNNIGILKNLKKLILTSNPLKNNLPIEIRGLSLEYLEIDILNENDQYLRNIIKKIKENIVDTYGDDKDSGGRG
ncbi:MAG: hypothetical protein WAZ12_04670 [Candidatus Absconditicoccaceae bacterium]